MRRTKREMLKAWGLSFLWVPFLLLFVRVFSPNEPMTLLVIAGACFVKDIIDIPFVLSRRGGIGVCWWLDHLGLSVLIFVLGGLGWLELGAFRLWILGLAFLSSIIDAIEDVKGVS